MRFQSLTGAGASEKPERVWITVTNGESSNTIGIGEPCAFTALDGLTVKKLATATGVLATCGLAGVAAQSIAAGATGIVQVYGITPMKVVVCNQTKASNTSSYASISLAAGLVLIPDTVGNAFSTAASVAASAFMPWGFIPVSFSTASSTLATTNTNSPSSVSQNIGTQVFLRLL